jgi:alcohol dehydrogenase
MNRADRLARVVAMELLAGRLDFTQFAVKRGIRTVAIARGPEKDEPAGQLGAHHQIDSVASDVAAELQKLGGARVIAATATDAMTAALGGPGLHGELLTLAVLDDPVQVNPMQLISISGTVHGHTSGASCDLEDTLNFAALQGIKPMVEVLPLPANSPTGSTTPRPGRVERTVCT